MTEPILLPSNQPPDRFYLGGPRIAEFRGEPDKGDRVPEDWVASTTTLAGHDRLGLTMLPSGTLLVDEIAAHSIDWLGEAHIERFGVDTKILVKLLDPGQRLPIHAHPATDFAHAHLGRSHGKAEAWYILAEGEVYLGLKDDMSLAALSEFIDVQDVEGLLARLHKRHVSAGDTVYVPAGTLHATGIGVFLTEIQEPEDLSILLEWRDFAIDGRADGHLGLGFDTALKAVDLRGRLDAEIDALITSGLAGPSILSAQANDLFRIARTVVDGEVALEHGFAVLIVTAGDLELGWGDAKSMHIPRGSTVVVPFAAGNVRVSGPGELLELRPPMLR